jgi:peptide/nickel transport system substrate-binding protein
MKQRFHTRGAKRLIAALVAIPVLVAGCGGGDSTAPSASPTPQPAPQAPAAEEPRVLRMAWGAAILTLDPPNEASTQGLSVVYNLYERLVDYDFAAARVVPSLASEWSVSPDGLTYTFTIDSDAVFSSGNKVTAEDARWSLQRIVDWPEAVQGFQVRGFLNDATITAVDDATLRIVLANPSAVFLTALAGHASSIIDSKVALANEVDGDLAKAFLAENVAGSGAFVLTEWRRDEFYRLARNENYWRDVPTNIDEVQVRFISEPSQQEALLRAGDVDVIFDAQADVITQLEAEGFVPSGGADVFTYYVAVNQAIKPFDDIRVRQALRYAVDYEGIINGLLDGRAVKAGSVLADGLSGSSPVDAQKYNYDPAKARELLAEAGLAGGFSTTIHLANLAVRGLGVPNELVATKIQSDLAAVGINASLEIEDIGSLFPRYREGSLPLTFWFFGPTFPDSDAIMTPHGDWNAQATTRVGFNNPQVTELIQNARVELDVTRRAALYRQAAEIVNEESPYLFLFRPENNPVATSDVELFYSPIWAVKLSQTVMR